MPRRIHLMQRGLGNLAALAVIGGGGGSGEPDPAGKTIIFGPEKFPYSSSPNEGDWVTTPGGVSIGSPGWDGTGKYARIVYNPSNFADGMDLGFTETPEFYFRGYFRINPPGYDIIENDGTGSGMKWFIIQRPSGIRQTWGANQLGGVADSTFGTHDNSSGSMPNPVNAVSGLWDTMADGNWHRYLAAAYTGTGTNGWEQLWIDGVKYIDTTGLGYDRSTTGFDGIEIGKDKVAAPLGTRTIDWSDILLWKP